MIEIQCTRCKLNIDDYIDVALIFDPRKQDVVAVHEQCCTPDDARGFVRPASQLNDEDIVTLVWNFLRWKDQCLVLQRENGDLRAEYNALLEEVRTQNARIAELTQLRPRRKLAYIKRNGTG